MCTAVFQIPHQYLSFSSIFCRFTAKHITRNYSYWTFIQISSFLSWQHLFLSLVVNAGESPNSFHLSAPWFLSQAGMDMSLKEKLLAQLHSCTIILSSLLQNSCHLSNPIHSWNEQQIKGNKEISTVLHRSGASMHRDGWKATEPQ